MGMVNALGSLPAKSEGMGEYLVVAADELIAGDGMFIFDGVSLIPTETTHSVAATMSRASSMVAAGDGCC